MRREFLVVRHPKPKLQDDWYMLDRWTSDAAHTVVARYREVTERGVVRRVYRAFCACGWRSASEWDDRSAMPAMSCPVGRALDERGRRLDRGGAHIIWFDSP